MSGSTLAIVGAVSMAVAVSAAAPKRSVSVEVAPPINAVARATVPANEGFVVTLPDRTRFGFVPTVLPDIDAGVTVEVWDLNLKPMQKLGSVMVEVGGPVVRSDTSPSFGIRVLRLITSK